MLQSKFGDPFSTTVLINKMVVKETASNYDSDEQLGGNMNPKMTKNKGKKDKTQKNRKQVASVNADVAR